MIKTKSRIYNISSKNSLNGSFNSVVQVSLPDLTFHQTNFKSAYLSVLHCEVPNSFYIVNYTNNILSIDNTLYTIPVGNYNAITLITAMLNLLPAGYSITYNSITNKYTFSHSLFDFTINGAQSTIYRIIGAIQQDLTSTSSTLTLPNVVFFLPIPRLNFRSNYLKFNNYNENDNSNDIFLSLQNNAGQQSMINYVNNDNLRFMIEDPNITTFNIYVTTDDQQLINFNGINWYLTFRIDIDYIDDTKNLNFNSVVQNFQNANY